MSPADKKVTIGEARQRLARVVAEAEQVVLIITAEQALKAERVVREAGPRRRRR
jgi:hypothetical protein